MLLLFLLHNYTKIKQGIRKQTAQAVISSVCAQTSTPADPRRRFNHQADSSSDNKLLKFIWKKALYIQHLWNSLPWCFLASWQKAFKPPTSREAARFHTDTNLLAFIPLLGHFVHSFPKRPSPLPLSAAHPGLKIQLLLGAFQRSIFRCSDNWVCIIAHSLQPQKQSQRGTATRLRSSSGRKLLLLV